jgi:hypothetical protein
MCDAWAAWAKGGLPEILYAKSRSCVSDATDSAAARAPWGLAKQKKKRKIPEDPLLSIPDLIMKSFNPWKQHLDFQDVTS